LGPAFRVQKFMDTDRNPNSEAWDLNLDPDDRHQNLIDWSLGRVTPFLKFQKNPFITFLRYYLQTERLRHTDTNRYENIISLVELNTSRRDFTFLPSLADLSVCLGTRPTQKSWTNLKQCEIFGRGNPGERSSRLDNVKNSDPYPQICFHIFPASTAEGKSAMGIATMG